MRREFLLNLILLLSLNLLVKPLYLFGVDLGVQNSLGAETYGLYFALWNFSILFQIVGDWGLQQYANQTLAGRPWLFAKYFPHFWRLKFWLLGFYIGLALFFAWLLAYPWAFWPYLLALLFNQVLLSSLLFVRAQLAALGRFRLDSLLSALDKCLLLIFGYALLHFEALSLGRFIASQTLSYVLTLVVSLCFLPRFVWSGGGAYAGALRWSLLKRSSPYALAVLLMSVYTRLDAVLLERLAGVGAGAAYAFAYRWLDALNMIGFLFAGLLLPMTARLFAQKDQAGLRDLFDLSLRLITAFSLPMACLLAYQAPWLAAQLIREEVDLVAKVTRILLPSVVAGAWIYVAGTMLLALERLAWLNRLFFGAMLFNVLTNILLIPRYGVVASAYLALLTQFGVAFAELWYLSRVLVWRPSGKMVLSFMFFVAIIFITIFMPWPCFWWALLLQLFLMALGALLTMWVSLPLLWSLLRGRA